jgi:hypothetical protein
VIVRTKSRQTSKTGQVRFLPIDSVFPCPENDNLYRPVNSQDKDIRALAASVKEHGVREPLVVTLDHFILSGHRRHRAARLAGLAEVPCRTEPISRHEDPGRFLVLLREYNRQREKSLDEKLREEIVSVNPADAYQRLKNYRKQASELSVESMEIPEAKTRAKISKAKLPMLNAIKEIIKRRKPFWPLSDRKIHYDLLNSHPLRHASKPGSRYRNDKDSWKDLCDLLTRARLAGEIAMNVIADSTRPVFTWGVYRGVQDFVRDELGGFLQGYYRDFMAPQPVHLEMLGEKNTLASIIKPVAADYCIPLTLGRGFCSLPPRYDLACRFRKSGKDKLVLIVVSDFDPEGEVIASSFARSMRDDFGIKNTVAIKAALSYEQVTERQLPPGGKAKMRGKSEYQGIAKQFVDQFGDDVYELEALEPEDLQEILRDTINGIIDVDLFNAEVEQEQQDAAQLDVHRRRALAALADVVSEGGDDDE